MLKVDPQTTFVTISSSWGPKRLQPLYLEASGAVVLRMTIQNVLWGGQLGEKSCFESILRTFEFLAPIQRLFKIS